MPRASVRSPEPLPGSRDRSRRPGRARSCPHRRPTDRGETYRPRRRGSTSAATRAVCRRSPATSPAQYPAGRRSWDGACPVLLAIVAAPEAVIAIFGPTGVGKTSVAIELAERLRAEGEDPIGISADALQVYRGLEVLTGVAAPEEQRRL